MNGADPGAFGLNQLSLLIYIVAFCLGTAAATLFFLIYRKLRIRMIGLYVLFVLAFLFLMILGFMETYLRFLGVPDDSSALTVFYLLNYAWGISTIWLLPLFFHEFLEAARPKYLAGASLGLMALVSLTAAWAMAWPSDGSGANRRLLSGLEAVWTPAVILALAYCVALLIRRGTSIGDALKRRIIRTILVLTAVFSPAIVIDILQPRIWERAPSFPYGLKLSVFYFIAWMLLGFAMVIRHFVGRITLSPEYQFRPELMDRFDFTPREREVIALLASGKTLNQVAAELFIAYKTVDNHVFNIYRKAGVGDRRNLLRLFR